MNVKTTSDPDYSALREVVRKRQTFKVLGDPQSPIEYEPAVDLPNRELILDAIATADWAPFHYDRGVDGIAQPWRFHVLWHQACRTIASEMRTWFPGMKPSNKLPAMLSACGACVLVTWVPQFSFGAEESVGKVDQSAEKRTQIDEEHLMASSAAVQNLLLLLTAAGMGTYWSSGGQFRTPEMFSRLGIDENQRLLATLFVEFPEQLNSSEVELERLAGKHRENRAPVEKWLRQIETIS